MMEFRKYAKRVSRLALLAHNPKACLTDGQGFRARISVVILLFAINIQAQEEPKKWEISGYAKSLQGIFNTEIPPLGKTVLNDNFLHNRLNFKWYPNDNLTIKADLRNRLFFGEFNRTFPGFKESLKNGGNDVLNLQVMNVGNQVIFHSIFDRLYLDYTKDNWEIRLGRQRINWGINTVWNPHDIFNAFAFTDFDYEERPGSDALRIKYYTGFASSIEIAVKAFDDPSEFVGGLLWKTNKWNYDFQVLAGVAQTDAVLGIGWAGNIGQLGFKGEHSIFISSDDDLSDVFAGTISLDYSFKEGLFVSTGLLFNSSENMNANILNFELSARNLYPYKWSTIISAGLPFTPLWNMNLALIYSPVDGNPLFVNPTLTYSLAENVDINLVGQIILQEGMDRYESPTQVAYLRVKWSF